MKLFYLFILMWIFAPQSLHSQGLKFSGGHQPIEKRTSLELFEHKRVEFVDNFEINFDLSLLPSNPIGYILRIKNEKINRIFNLFYDEEQNHCVFRLNEEGKSSLITIQIDQDELVNLKWIKISVKLDLKKNEIKLHIHNTEEVAKNLGLPKVYSPTIIFGKSDYLIDLPNFAIKNLSIGNTTHKISIPLRENDGNEVHDLQGNHIGNVSNPEWLINDSYRWKFINSYASPTQAGSNYNDALKEVYYFNRDSIIIYNVKSQHTKVVKYASKCPIEFVIGTSFIDKKANKLFVYETHYVNPTQSPSVASLDLSTYTWKIENEHQLKKELNHHGYFFNPDSRKFTIFGGYGQMLYSNKFYSYDLDKAEWNLENKMKGETIFPRYFLSIGSQPNHNAVYIFGGMGNESGEHIVGRKYFYDLYKLDTKTNTISKLWEIPWETTNMVPGRGLVILDSTHFYTLAYPEHVSNSFFKLYKFNIKDGKHEIVGDSVPIYSDKITTRAQLYYDQQLESLFALVQESKDDVSSTLKIYSLNFPPISNTELSSYSVAKSKNIFPIGIISTLILLGISYLWYKKQQRKKQKTAYLLSDPSEKIAISLHHKNSIYMFGEFTVLDRSGRDVTHLFSTRLKQTLCVIMESSITEGITSKHLSNILWPDKSEDKVKNSRGVTINHLRKALSELDGIELEFDKGKFKIVQSEDFYCDYKRCFDIIKNNLGENREELLQILSRGNFLQSSNDPLFDPLKANLERVLETALCSELAKSITAKVPQLTISLANAIFKVDPINDYAVSAKIKALLALKLDIEARSAYQSFVVEYKKRMGENYPYSFQELESKNV